MDDFMWIASILAFSLLLGAACLVRYAVRKEGMRHLWFWMLMLFLLQTVALGQKGISEGVCPLHGISDIIFFMAWALNGFYLILGRVYRMSVLGLFTLPAIALCMVASWLFISAEASEWSSSVITWHVAIAMLAYGALGLSAVAGFAFLMQDHFLKGHRVTGFGSKLPPVRTLQSSMARLMATGFILLGASQVFGYLSGLPINAAKSGIAGFVTFAYLAVIAVYYRKGMPGRFLACLSIVLYLGALAIFLVLE